MGGFFGCCRSMTSGGGSSGSAALGPNLNFASPSGTIAAAPAGFNTNTGRLTVTLALGSAVWASLTASADGQLLEIRNADGTNTLTLPQSSWGGVGDLLLNPGNKVLAYYDSGLGAWQVTAP